MTGLTVANLRASFGQNVVVDGVDLVLPKGNTLSLLGPSGCGKTTLLRSLAGLHDVDAGSIHIEGTQVTGGAKPVPAQSRRVGMVFQDGALFPHLSVLDNVLYGLDKNSTKRALEVLELVDMVDYGQRLPGTLSGGQQQRVALARALAPDPTILLLDEPFSALDAGLRVQLRREVKHILREVGTTAVIVTHDQEEAFILGDQVAVMHHGKIEQLDSPDGLYRRPSTPWVATFVGEANLLSGVVTGDFAETIIGTVPLQTPHDHSHSEKPVQILVRPEQLAITAQLTTDSPDEAKGTVTAIEYFGHDVRYEVLLKGTTIGVRTTTADLAVGQQVALCFTGTPTVCFT